MGLAIGVDVGGTKVAAGVVDDDGRVLARLRRDTPAQDPAVVIDHPGGDLGPTDVHPDGQPHGLASFCSGYRSYDLDDLDPEG